MARKYLVVSVGPNKKTGEMQSACAPVVIHNGSTFIGSDRRWISDYLEFGTVVEIEETVIAAK